MVRFGGPGLACRALGGAAGRGAVRRACRPLTCSKDSLAALATARRRGSFWAAILRSMYGGTIEQITANPFGYGRGPFGISLGAGADKIVLEARQAPK